MAISVTMPRLSDTMQEGTLNKWVVKVGDAVKAGDHLADVETDKATMELQAFDDGTVALLAVREGEIAPVGKLIMVLAEKGESIEAAVGKAGAPQGGKGQSPESTVQSSAVGGEAEPESGSGSGSGSAPSAPAGAGVAPVMATAGGGRVKVSPLARKLAEQAGVDVSRIAGSGPGGRIVKRDILAATGQAPGIAAGNAAKTATQDSAEGIKSAITGAQPELVAKEVPLTTMRKTIARRLVESKTTIPHFTVTVTADMDLILGPRGAKAQLEGQGVNVSVNDFVIRAVALALARHPEINASWGQDNILQHGVVNIGVAVALPAEKGSGLVVPVLRNVTGMKLPDIHAEVQRLAEKARGPGLTVQDMADGTFTISNLGMFGVDHFEAIINPPQGAILAVGAGILKPVIRDGAIVAGYEMSLTLSADHRVIDGVQGAKFLQTLRQMLEQPAILLM